MVAAALLFLAAANISVTAERASTEPVLAPSLPWNQTGLFNPTAVAVNGETVLLFRATDAKMTSRIGYAKSKDGLHFETRAEPVLVPEAAYEKDGGVEDPRVVKLGGTYYLTYTGFNRKDAQLCLATSTDLVHWVRKGVMLRAYQGTWNTKWTKSGAIIPEKINGKWWIYYLGTRTDGDGKERLHGACDVGGSGTLGGCDAGSGIAAEGRGVRFARDGAGADASGDTCGHSGSVQRGERGFGLWSCLGAVRPA